MAAVAHKRAHHGGLRTRPSEAVVTDELRGRFFLEIQATAPEVLADLKQCVWSEYQKHVRIRTCSVDGRSTMPNFPFAMWPPSLRDTATRFARERWNLVYQI